MRRPALCGGWPASCPYRLGVSAWKLAHGYAAAHKDGIVRYIAHELRHVCASLLIVSGATDMQVTRQMGHSKIETTKNIYGHLFAQDRAFSLQAINQAVSRLYVQDDTEDQAAQHAKRPSGIAAPGGLARLALPLQFIGPETRSVRVITTKKPGHNT